MLDRESRVKTTKCFVYNNAIFFAVPESMMSRAIGPGALNIRKIQEQIGKRVKIIREPAGTTDIEKFIQDIIEPVRFKSIQMESNSVIINAGPQSKAALIGRNRRREDELKGIIHDFLVWS